MLGLFSWLQVKSQLLRVSAFSRADFVTESGSVRDGWAVQIRPEGDGPTGDLAEAGAMGLPDLMAAITTAQAKNSRSRS